MSLCFFLLLFVKRPLATNIQSAFSLARPFQLASGSLIPVGPRLQRALAGRRQWKHTIDVELDGSAGPLVLVHFHSCGRCVPARVCVYVSVAYERRDDPGPHETPVPGLCSVCARNPSVSLGTFTRLDTQIVRSSLARLAALLAALRSRIASPYVRHRVIGRNC